MSASDLRFLFLSGKFRREDEQQADAAGSRLMTRVGVNPEGAVTAQLALLRQAGATGGDYLDTHPSMKERVDKARSHPAGASGAKQLFAGIEAEEVINQEYAFAAEQCIEAQSWNRLGLLTRQWLSRGEENALALYYRGIYQSAGLKQATQARRTFYRAIELDPDNRNARLELCVALFGEGRKLESVCCYGNIANGDDRREFRARTFGDHLWVGGESEAVASVIVSRDASGKKYITNSQFARQRGLEPVGQGGVGSPPAAPCQRPMR